MFSVSFPSAPKVEKIAPNQARFLIEECYPGFGTTLGNALRRTLLSSLPGVSVTSVKIKGITHEFTTIKGIKEDVVQIVMNLKKVRFSLSGVEKAIVTLKAKGEKEVRAKDIKTGSEVEIANPEELIATLTSSTAELEMELKIEKGIGYVPVEQQDRKEKEIGTIAVDAIFNPVKRVNFTVENMRVGKRTDYDRIILEITTDGTITPENAYEQAVEILMGQFNAISGLTKNEKVEKNPGSNSLLEAGFSNRTLNVFKKNGLQTEEDLVKLTEKELTDLSGMGSKCKEEVLAFLNKKGLKLAE